MRLRVWTRLKLRISVTNPITLTLTLTLGLQTTYVWDDYKLPHAQSHRLYTACNAKRVFATAEASVCPSVRPSVRLSVTLLYCVKTTQLRIMKSSLWATARTLDFLWQIFLPLGEGIPLERGRQTRVPPVKSRHFTAIGSCSVKTVAHRHRHAAYHNKHCWHRWPWTTLNPQNRVFSEFLAILGCDAHLEWIFAEIYWR